MTDHNNDQISYDELKDIIKHSKNIDNLSNINILLINLCKIHSYLFKSTIMLYDHNQYCYYRYFYIFYILIKYVYYNLSENLEKEHIRYIYINFTKYSRKYSFSKFDKNLIEKYKNILIDHFDYFYEQFFINENIYFSVYFNNLIKYCLPLPIELNIYSPILTFRSNVDRIYKKNNIDYYNKILEQDTIKTKRKVERGFKNRDMIKNEIDIHLPIKYFNPKLVQNSIFCICIYNKIYLCSTVTKTFETLSLTVLYQRNINKFDIEKHKKRVSFETLNEQWGKVDLKLDIDLKDIVYISVLQKLTNRALLNVFNPINFNREFLKKLYHETGLNIDKTKLNKLLNNPTFFSLTPFNVKYQIDYTKDRKCLFYDVKKSINNLLDLTNNTITNNPFVEKKLKGKYYDLSKINNYYSNKKIPIIEHQNFKCLTLDNHFKKVPYCDINSDSYYVGRRKLQEILFKTRKYIHNDIWNIKTNQNDIYKSKSKQQINKLYHPDYNINTYNYDAYILSQLKSVGFWFTDYTERIKTGGEILLCDPLQYIKLDSYKNNQCFVKDDKIIKL